MEQHGDAATIEQAKKRLIAALRTWAAWAGVRRDGADAPRWVSRRDLATRSFSLAYEDETDWVLVSGEFVVGRVHRPSLADTATGNSLPQKGPLM